MGFPINEKITVELHWEDVALLVSALTMYNKTIKAGGKKQEQKDKLIEDASRLINRLGEELFNAPDAELEDYNM